MEDVVKVKELQFEINSTNQNRKELVQAEEELQQYYKLDEEYWSPKSGMKWFNDGDRNTNFFQSYVKGRRRRLHINEMENEQGVLIKDPTSLAIERIQVPHVMAKWWYTDGPRMLKFEVCIQINT
ncbi:hypothetical protein H5410_002281 [Solanum commersonii]|uniref:Uncharacterized protein n=1 Tax=Solanum commersonii TaxID=4109 RepID=A0A9J6B1N2_SOLCO|nr:hypothetical protein H5410_002281 [Solanum commersonii]